ncbi:hypothetical protein [Nitrososphaera viennensis]|uniref:Uncharacterized protein n=2 Tax=Nitrososphaera viennensis TaxID=1034015 RepID=A0A060HDB2_9ARCH|nr:hypothetical protein [Nitrososphaera viennensis]AIC14719.1 hypothetical protein NVIE_005230 [Nitrososphaera viennensis EN76]UVS69682.1 hypothetical protein NWT39_02570 [Nitrososphaera viennensis]
MKQDAMPLPYGALDYYQIHYIVSTGDNNGANTQQFLARCEPITKGHFSEKRVVAVKWTGASAFADKLQQDERLTELLKQVLLHEREVRVDPLDGHVRIYGRWNHDENLKANPAMVEIADIIAGHIKAAL